MGVKSFVDADGNKQWADEHSKVYQSYLASQPEPATVVVAAPEPAPTPIPVSPKVAPTKAKAQPDADGS